MGDRKLGSLTSKHVKLNVCKNDLTGARNKLSFYFLYVNGNAKNGCFVVKRYAVREVKRIAVCSTQGQKRVARSTQGGVTLMVTDYGINLSGIGFEIK